MSSHQHRTRRTTNQTHLRPSILAVTVSTLLYTASASSSLPSASSSPISISIVDRSSDTGSPARFSTGPSTPNTVVSSLGLVNPVSGVPASSDFTSTSPPQFSACSHTFDGDSVSTRRRLCITSSSPSSFRAIRFRRRTDLGSSSSSSSAILRVGVGVWWLLFDCRVRLGVCVLCRLVLLLFNTGNSSASSSSSSSCILPTSGVDSTGDTEGFSPGVIAGSLCAPFIINPSDDPVSDPAPFNTARCTLLSSTAPLDNKYGVHCSFSGFNTKYPFASQFLTYAFTFSRSNRI
ncbi:hypothetical protein P691DRAFT_42081 [Macrolepiota fuliginosa MF-IS2]|uniref:Uncharacterized protein n=1 Tax=Macrolepiota fuliginosa MF-IS2 TaxID=1400762 RepID=A0A9P5XN34_9AGAR|nr:hypothetical protein P691DRAFT_42081 [Macrolepiota fuliginosa MF-IS2]